MTPIAQALDDALIVLRPEADSSTRAAMPRSKAITAPRPLGLRPDERVFAIGDIHGRLDLFVTLLKEMVSDVRPPSASNRIIVLGDIVDRGPSSRALVERFMRYTQATPDFIVLKGNHEQMMTRALKGDIAAFRSWLDYGGEETLRSWGVETRAVGSSSTFALIKAAREAVGEPVLNWLEALPVARRIGDVLFVHAGVRPGVALEAQSDEDLLWIRREFIDSDIDHGALVVHGHTIVPEEPQVLSNRIALDTGAYKSGRLSGVRLEGEEIQVFMT